MFPAIVCLKSGLNTFLVFKINVSWGDDKIEQFSFIINHDM